LVGFIKQWSIRRHLREMVLEHGIEEIPDPERWLGMGKRYSLFSEHLFGVEKPISDSLELGSGAAAP